MRPRSKGRSRPSPGAAILKTILREVDLALRVEEKVKYNLIHAFADQKTNETGLSDRDSVVHDLRFLKVWFQLPSEVFLTAVNILDRFLTKMKVQRKFIACVSITCLHLAAEMHKCSVDAAALIAVSHTKCTVSDMQRMAAIIRGKLTTLAEPPATTADTTTTDDDNNNNNTVASGALSYVQLFLRYFQHVAAQQNIVALSTRMLNVAELLNRLEVVMLDAQCASARPSVIALTLIEAGIQRFLLAEIPAKSPYYTVEMLKLLTELVNLRSLCMIKSSEIAACHYKIMQALNAYETGVKRPQPQALTWRFSTRTLNAIRPSTNFSSNLCIIREF